MLNVNQYVAGSVLNALHNGDGLCAKWMPRQGQVAHELRKAAGLSPKAWRKTLVNMTKVVETQMCNKEWDGINFNHVPSVAISRYRRAFKRHTDKFGEWAAQLAENVKTPNKNPGVKVNAGAVYPYNVLGDLIHKIHYNTISNEEKNAIRGQWAALPNYGTSARVLPVADVSGSMGVGVSGSTTALDVAVSLALYFADKNTGSFKDVFATFSGRPQFEVLKGDIIDKVHQMTNAHLDMNTDIMALFKEMLQFSVKHKVPANEMPEIILILSDMQFDQCVAYNTTALEAIKEIYNHHGYEIPNVVFWNINAHNNAPVKAHTSGAALVSGFSPSIAKSILAMDKDNFTPYGMMMKTIMSDRYSLGENKKSNADIAKSILAKQYHTKFA